MSDSKQQHQQQQQQQPQQLPTSMKCIRQHAYGEAAKVLTMENDVEVPTAIGETILVKIMATSINPVDYKLLHGDLSMVKKLHFPHTPGNDFAGIILSMGSACKRDLHIGDRVYGSNADTQGTFAQYVLVEEKFVSRIPAMLTFPQAAALPMVAETALTGLHKAGDLTNKRVLVLGGSGGTGSLAIQLAKILGASHVATTCSSKNTDYTRNLGADHVIDYTAVNFADALSVEPGFDVIFDTVGGKDQWDNAQRILNKNGTFITIVGDVNQDPVNVSNAISSVGKVLGRKVASMFTSHNYIFHFNSADHENLDEISLMVENGKLRTDTLIGKTYTFSLEQCIAMYQQSESSHSRGKNVMVMEGDTNEMNQQA